MNELIHTGVMGMRWGKRKSKSSMISNLSTQNKKLNTKLDTTIAKSEKNKTKLDKATKKVAKFRPYLTDIGKTVQREIGNHRRRVLSSAIRKDKHLTKKIDRIKKRMVTNSQSIKTMRTPIKDINVASIAAGKAFING